MERKEAFHKLKQCVVGFPGTEERVGQEIHEDTLTEYFPKTMKDARSQIQETQRPTSKRSAKEPNQTILKKTSYLNLLHSNW